jgi:hypothetical protein
MLGYIPIARYNTVLWRDPSWEIATTKIFREEDHFFIISKDLWQPFYYSGFPAVHAITLQLFYITGISITNLSIYMPPLLSLLSMILIERLFFLFTKDYKVSILGATIFTIWPESIYYRSQLIRQNIAFILLVATMYFYIKGQLSQNRKYMVLCIISFVSLVIAHHFTTFIALYLLIGITVTDKLFRNSKSQKTDSGRFYMLFALSLMTTLYWLTYAEPVMYNVIGQILFTFQRMTEQPKYLVTVLQATSEPTPLIIKVLSFTRIFLLWSLAAYGAQHSIRSAEKSTKFFLSVLLILIILFIPGIFLGVTPDPVRYLLFLSPSVSLFASLSIGKMRRLLSVIAISIIILPTMFLLWGNLYAPMYLYDPNVAREIRYSTYCYSPIGYIEASLWLTRNTDPSHSIYLPSDTRIESTLYSYMDTSFYYSIYRIAYRETEVYEIGFRNVILGASSKDVYLIVGKDSFMASEDLLFIENNMVRMYENSDCYIFVKYTT